MVDARPKGLSPHQLSVLEAHLRHLRCLTAAETAVVTLEEFEELLRVYRLAVEFDAAEDVSPFHRFFSLDRA